MLKLLERWKPPLRALAMLLFSVSVIFLLIGVREVAYGGEKIDPLQAASDRVKQSTTTTTTTTEEPEPTPGKAKVCVYSYSPEHTNWASDITKVLKDKDVRAVVADKYAIGSVETSVVYYKETFEDQAEKIAIDSGLDPEPEVTPLPEDADLGTQCKGDIALILSE